MTRAAPSSAWLFGLWDRVRTSFWLVPSLMALGAGVLSHATVALDRRLGSEAMGAWGWVWSGGADGARSVLSTIAGSMATVAGVVFSVNIVALTLASSQFGPRLLRNFTRDLGNQLVLGTFISTFLYSLLVLRVIRSTDEGGFVPELSVTCAVLLAVGGVGVLIYFIGHVAEAIQAESLVAAIGLARAHGVAVVALRDAFHIGRIGDYGEQVAAAGLVSVHFVNVTGIGPLVAPFGGADARFATNPICIALPATGTRPETVLDLATSVVALGKCRVAYNKGVPVPGDALIEGARDP